MAVLTVWIKTNGSAKSAYFVCLVTVHSPSDWLWAPPWTSTLSFLLWNCFWSLSLAVFGPGPSSLVACIEAARASPLASHCWALKVLPCLIMPFVSYFSCPRAHWVLRALLRASHSACEPLRGAVPTWAMGTARPHGPCPCPGAQHHAQCLSAAPKPTAMSKM